MPVLCALVPAFKVAVARHFDPKLRARSLIVADRLERGHAIAVDDAAFGLGARIGMTLVQATACAPKSAVTLDEPARNRAIWERMLDALDAASPLVEDACEGVAFLEMRGIEGGHGRWLASGRAALASDDAIHDLPVAFAVAENKFVARAAARVHDGSIVLAGEERTFLAPLSLYALDLDETVVERLHLLGIKTLGNLAALPHGPFVRRFGPQAARWHAHACGLDDEPIVPRPRRLVIDASLYGEGTAEREEQLLFALRTLVARVASDVAAAGKRCGFLRLQIECEDGERMVLTALLAQATSQSATMFEMLRAKLEGITLHSPVVGLVLGAERLEEGGAELSLFAGNDPDPDVVALALARLEAALGPQRALRGTIVPGHRYETRVAYEPFLPGSLSQNLTGCRKPVLMPATATLVYRLIERRPIVVPIAHGLPIAVDGKAVVDVAGPWRTTEGWWSAVIEGSAPAHRSDAFDVLLEDGALYRIAREGDAWWLIGAFD